MSNPLAWRRHLRVAALVLGCFFHAELFCRAADEESSLAGVYRDEQISVELRSPVPTGTYVRYSGVIRMGGQEFPLQAQAEGGRLTGTFQSEGDDFGFTGSVVGKSFTFTTDGTTYRLKKQTRNPLAKPPPRANPLVRSQTNPPAATLSRPVDPVPAGLRFKRYTLADDANIIGGEAFSLLIPPEWKVEGGLGWRAHPANPVYMAVRVSSPNGTEALEALPALPFVWMEGGIPLFPIGSNYLGNEVAAPIEQPLVYVRDVIVPRYRPGLRNAQIVSAQDLPKVADLISEGPSEPGVLKKCNAARIRLEYQEGGRTMQEDIYCALLSVTVASRHITFWGPDRNYAFKAEKGNLDARSKILQSMVSSFRPTLPWFNRYVQLLQLMSQSPADPNQYATQISRLAARTSEEITDARRQAYDRLLVSQARINHAFSQSLGGLDEYHNGFEGGTVELPSGYYAVWANALGDYLLTNDPQADPNTGGSKGWQRLEKSR